MDRLHALELNFGEWVSLLRDEMGEPDYRAKQICEWIYKKRRFTFEEMTNLSKELRGRLDTLVRFAMPALEKTEMSPLDGTLKYLWRLEDGEQIESVFLRHPQHTTACLSSQVGCPLACAFCVTGQGGFVRNLSAGEILAQFLAIEAHQKGPIQNVVYMGMGEPLLNAEQVFRSVRMLRDPHMRGLGQRHITISTAGVVPGIDALAAESLGVGLSVSLHAANDSLRSHLMPLNRKYPLALLRKALLRYQRVSGDRITLEYMLLQDVNDSPAHAEELVAWIGDLKAYVNLIPYNAGAGNFQRPPRERAERFRDHLRAWGINAELRRERGGDVRGACGQLRGRESAPSPAKASREVLPVKRYGGAPCVLLDGVDDRRPERREVSGSVEAPQEWRKRGEASGKGERPAREERSRGEFRNFEKAERKEPGVSGRLSSRRCSSGRSGGTSSAERDAREEKRPLSRFEKRILRGGEPFGQERNGEAKLPRKDGFSRAPRADSESGLLERREYRGSFNKTNKTRGMKRNEEGISQKKEKRVPEERRRFESRGIRQRGPKPSEGGKRR
jgi:23S rRNA (adenine2503-C2)-methyltransferase